MSRRAFMVSLGLVLWGLVLWGLALWPVAATAQNGDQALLGLRLFNQSCRVCHTKPQLASPQYGPALSTKSLGGKADIIRDTIANGTPHMPGFKYHFKPAEIDALAAYIKTIPAPSDAPRPVNAGSHDSDF